MNSYFLKAMGKGDYCLIEDFSAMKLATFLASISCNEYQTTDGITANDFIHGLMESFIAFGLNPRE